MGKREWRIKRNADLTTVPEEAKALWNKLTLPERTAFVKWLAADTGVQLFDEAEARKRFGRKDAAE